MKDKIFIDTNILIYCFDKEHEKKRTIAKKILENFYMQDHYFISTQIVLECANVLANKLKPAMSEKEITLFINTLPKERIALIEINDILTALSIKKKHKLSLWDSLVIAAAQQLTCNCILTDLLFIDWCCVLSCLAYLNDGIYKISVSSVF
jgi:predicted nucleic acid-binding protein